MHSGLVSLHRRGNVFTSSYVGSPDPDGRQINGLGGGASSLSKAAIVDASTSFSSKPTRDAGHPFPGLPWIDTEPSKVAQISDIIYRFGQVEIKKKSIDWGSTCGNLIAAVAVFALNEGLLDSTRVSGQLPPIHQVWDENRQRQQGNQMPLDHSVILRILAHDTGKVFKAHVPVMPYVTKGTGAREKKLEWVPTCEGSSSIAGVPGTDPGIVIESPLQDSVLSTGNERDEVVIDGKTIEVSVVDAGLPVIFVSAQSLGIPLSSLIAPPQTIDSNRPLMDLLERVREAASHLTPSLAAKFSPPAPKICVLHPRATYTSSGGQVIHESEMDLVARTVSVGQMHRTIPATTLSALVAARCFPHSVVTQVLGEASSQTPSPATRQTLEELRCPPEEAYAITAGQPAGLSSASVTTVLGGGGQRIPNGIAMIRTAKRIMEGHVFAPLDVDRNEDLRAVLSRPRQSDRRAKKESTKD